MEIGVAHTLCLIMRVLMKAISCSLHLIVSDCLKWIQRADNCKGGQGLCVLVMTGEVRASNNGMVPPTISCRNCGTLLLDQHWIASVRGPMMESVMPL